MRTYTNAELADIIEDEGLGYAVSEYVSADQIEDPTMRALWEHASLTLAAIGSQAFAARKVREGG